MKRPSLLAWLHLVRTYNKIHHHAMDQLKCSNMSPARFDVLAQLSVAPGISQQELSDRLLVTKGNTCTLLDKMAAQGLVERCADPEDRRSYRLYLTEEGRQLAETLIPAQEDFIHEHMSALSDEEQRTLLALLRDLDRSLERHEH
jgi:MarR family transcriptional regulator, 2-MHQ and catechol-resistance regulon repressor